jgi:hypothetical protein
MPLIVPIKGRYNINPKKDRSFHFMRIAVANDHTAAELKNAVVAHLNERGFTEITDFSPAREECRD